MRTTTSTTDNEDDNDDDDDDGERQQATMRSVLRYIESEKELAQLRHKFNLPTAPESVNGHEEDATIAHTENKNNNTLEAAYTKRHYSIYMRILFRFFLRTYKSKQMETAKQQQLICAHYHSLSFALFLSQATARPTTEYIYTWYMYQRIVSRAQYSMQTHDGSIYT